MPQYIPRRQAPVATGAPSGIRRAIAEKLGAGTDQTNSITPDR
jgi:hypothetical protein